MANVKAGDKITVAGIGLCDWVPDMDEFVGKTLTVKAVGELDFDGTVWMDVVETDWRFYNDACEKIGEDGKMQVIDGIAQ